MPSHDQPQAHRPGTSAAAARAPFDTRSSAFPFVAVAAALGGLYLFLAWRWNFVVDDAFISLRYAAHLAAGHGLVYNPGEWVEGYSNPSWTVLLAGLLELGAPAETAARVLGMASGLAVLLLTLAGCRGLGLGLWASAAAGTVLATSRSFTFWTASGLETGLFAGLLLLLWLGVVRSAAGRGVREEQDPPSRGPWPSPLLLGCGAALLAITRPEGAGALIALPFGLLLGRRNVAGGLSWRGAARAALAGLALFGLFLAWRVGTYGALLPNPFHAKVGGAGDGLARGVSYLGAYLLREGIVWLLPLILLTPRWSFRLLSLLTTIAGYGFFILLVGGDGLYLYRFPANVLPLVAVAVALGVERLMAADSRWRVGAGVAVLLAALLPWTGSAFHAGAPVEALRQAEETWADLGRILERNTTAETTLATNVAGRLPFYAARPTLDLLGLTNAHIARRRTETLGTGYAGHEKADATYVLSRRPDILHISLLETAPRQLATRPPELAARLAAGPLRGYAELFGDPNFLAAYRPVLIRIDAERQRLVFARRGRPGEALPAGVATTLSWEAGPGPGG